MAVKGTPLPLSAPSLVLRYAAFAALATLANLGMQRVVFAVGEDARLFALAVALGTSVGLVVKYVLDKRWIFYDQTHGLLATGQQFALYAALGLLTTALFWVTKSSFWFAFGTHQARELGALLGLALGYALKYRLDRTFVFNRNAK